MIHAETENDHPIIELNRGAIAGNVKRPRYARMSITKSSPIKYAATIREDACPEIYASDTARIEHRGMWTNFGEWDRRNPLESFIGKNAETQARVSTSIFFKLRDQIAADYKITPKLLMRSEQGIKAHPGRMELIFRCLEAGLTIKSIAGDMGVSLSRIYAAMNAHHNRQQRRSRRLEHLKLGAA